MIVSSLLSEKSSFQFGKHTLVELTPNVQTTISDTPENIASAEAHARLGNLKIHFIDDPLAASASTQMPRSWAVSILAVQANDTINVGGVAFTFKAGSGQTTADVGIGANSTAAATNLKAAINANTTLAALGVVARDVITVGSGDAKLTIETPGSTAVTVGNATSRVDPIGAAASPAVTTGTLKVAVATITAAQVERPVVFPSTVSHVIAQVRTSAGAIKAVDSNIYVSGRSVFIDDQGTTDLGATDTITLIAFLA